MQRTRVCYIGGPALDNPGGRRRRGCARLSGRDVAPTIRSCARRTPTAALEYLQQPDLRIDLLLTDVVMPGMNGPELAKRADALRPGLKVLYVTGYSRNAIVHQGRLDPGVELMQKPITQEALAGRVRGLLDARKDPRRWPQSARSPEARFPAQSLFARRARKPIAGFSSSWFDDARCRG
jgi:CheY-like chemotaxis protein